MISLKIRPILQSAFLALSLAALIPATNATQSEWRPNFYNELGRQANMASAPSPTPQGIWRRVRISCGPRCDGELAALTVFSAANGEGRTQGFMVGRFRADEGRLAEIGNDNISSIRVEDGYDVYLCDGEGDGNGAPRCQGFRPGQFNLSAFEMDKIVSYVEVYSDPVTVYSGDDWRGRGQGYNPGRYFANRGDLDFVGNDAIKSVRVRVGYRARLCQHEGNGNGDGTCQEFRPGHWNVSDEMRDQTSFISVWACGGDPSCRER